MFLFVSVFFVISSAFDICSHATDCSTCLGLVSPLASSKSSQARHGRHLASCTWCSGHSSNNAGTSTPEIFRTTGLIGVCVNSSVFCPSKTYETHLCPNFFSGSWSPNSYWLLLIVTIIVSMIAGLFIGALVFIHNSPTAPLTLAVVSVFFPSAAVFSAFSSLRQKKTKTTAQKTSTCHHVVLVALVITEVLMIFLGFFAGWMMDFYQYAEANCFLDTPNCQRALEVSPVPYTMMITLGLWYMVVFIVQPVRLYEAARQQKNNSNLAEHMVGVGGNNINTIELDDERQNLLG